MVTALMFQIAQWRNRLLRAHPDHLRIAKGAARISAFVLVGKCAGALKEIAIAYQYGISNVVDAYQFTVTLVTWLPGTVLAVLSVVLVPAFVDLRKKSKEQQVQFVGELQAAALVTGVIFAIALYLFWPLLMDTMGGAFAASTREMCRQLMLGMAPTGVLMLAASVYAARLQARERHINTLLEGVPAAAILCCVLLAGNGGSVLPLIIGTVIGLAVQALWLGALARNADGVHGGLKLSFRSPEWIRTFGAVRTLMIGQIALCFCAPLDQYFMAHLGEGANGTLGYANRVLALLLGMGAMAAARATLPILSDILHQGDHERARRTALTWSFVALGAGIVCVAVSWVAAPKVIALLFQRGAFTPDDTIAVARVFRWGLLQLPFYFAVLVCSQMLASEGRFSVMAKIAVAGFIVKAVGNCLLVPRLGIPGAQLSTAIMYASTFVVCMVLLRMRPDAHEGSAPG